MADLNNIIYTDGVHDVLAAYVNRLLAATLRSEYKNVETLSADVELTNADTPIQRFDCGGANRIVTMPAGDAVENHPFWIVNASDGGETITVKSNDETVIHAVINEGDAGYLLPDGNGAYRSLSEGFYKNLFGIPTEKTVASGVLTLDRPVHKIQPQSGTADDVDTISGVPANTLFVLYASDPGTDTLTFKNGTGNISCFGGADLALSRGMIVGFYDGTTVYLAGGGGGKRIVLSSNSPRVYTTNDTWSKPTGLHHVIVEVVGGGGGGGGCAASTSINPGCANGGGGGEYASKKILAASLGATETVTVGAGGGGGAAGFNAGSAGGNSSFGAHVSANGGSGGDGDNCSYNASSVPFLGVSSGGGGGTGGSGGDISIPGGASLNGIKWAALYVQASVGGSSYLSNQSKPSTGSTSDENGVAGLAYGGGGTGARSSNDANARAGGAGANGVVIVWEYVEE